MQVHHHPEVAGIISHDFFTLALLMRRLYRHGAYDVEGTTCHVLATALADTFKHYSVVHGGVWSSDGKTRPQHSWLTIDNSDWIVDIKPVHCVTFSPLLVYLGEGSIFAHVYKEHRSKALKKVLDSVETKNNTERLKGVIAEIFKKEPITHEEVQAVLEGYF